MQYPLLPFPNARTLFSIALTLQPPRPLQGVAHLVEHVTFLGSKRREDLLGTGARANAYTDFHHTVFHVHAPAVNGITGQPMLPQVRGAERGRGCGVCGWGPGGIACGETAWDGSCVLRVGC